MQYNSHKLWTRHHLKAYITYINYEYTLYICASYFNKYAILITAWHSQIVNIYDICSWRTQQRLNSKCVCIVSSSTNVCKYLHIKYNYAEKWILFLYFSPCIVALLLWMLLSSSSSPSSSPTSLFSFFSPILSTLLQNEIYFNAIVLYIIYIHLWWYCQWQRKTGRTCGSCCLANC